MPALAGTRKKKACRGKGEGTLQAVDTAEAGEDLAVRGERVCLRRFAERGLGHYDLLSSAFRFPGIMHADRKRQG